GHIAREAHVNVPRHGGAEPGVVRLSTKKRAWKLSIDDDGKGFQFVGRFSLAQLDNNRHGPTVIKELVKAVGGDLTIDSRPGRGPPLEIIFPQVKTAAHALQQRRPRLHPYYHLRRSHYFSRCPITSARNQTHLPMHAPHGI